MNGQDDHPSPQASTLMKVHQPYLPILLHPSIPISPNTSSLTDAACAVERTGIDGEVTRAT